MEGGVVCAMSVRAVREGLCADLCADAAFQLDGDLLGDSGCACGLGGNSDAVAVAGGRLKVKANGVGTKFSHSRVFDMAEGKCFRAA